MPVEILGKRPGVSHSAGAYHEHRPMQDPQQTSVACPAKSRRGVLRLAATTTRSIRRPAPGPRVGPGRPCRRVRRASGIRASERGGVRDPGRSDSLSVRAASIRQGRRETFADDMDSAARLPLRGQDKAARRTALSASREVGRTRIRLGCSRSFSDRASSLDRRGRRAALQRAGRQKQRRLRGGSSSSSGERFECAKARAVLRPC